MSSAYSEPHLEDTSSLDGHENNDKDEKNRNISKSEQKDKVKKNLKNKYLNKMFYLLKEFLIMVVVAIAYAAITNEPPKVSKSPAAYRFFPEDAYVTDWYRGEISDAINQARSADIAFVMFYAPWDAECQHARKEFQTVARFMHQQITFSAVNCWQPGSECKTQYSKVNKWPILIAYPTHGRGVQYNGPLVAAHMMAFLKKLISPFSKEETIDLMSQHDVVVTGNVYAGPFSRDFNIFYQVALRLLERDPLQEIAVTVETQAEYNLPELHIQMWNETLIYPYSEWEIESILNWILKNVHHLTTWISPSGSKSISLSSYLQPGPALILFTPRNPLATHSDYYSMLRAFAFDYNSCGVDQIINKLISIFHKKIQSDRKERYMQYLKLIEECSLKKFKVKRVTSANLWSNISYCLGMKYLRESLHQNNNNMINYFGGMKMLCSRFLANFDYGYEVPENARFISDNIVYKTSKLSDIPDYRSPKNLKKAMRIEICKTLLIAQKYQHLAFSSELYNNDVVGGFDVKGLKCKTNKTLTFIAMDSLRYHHYAEKLGIDLSKRPNKTAVVILDDKMESHYIMSGEVTENNLRNYVYNYTKGSLKRALSSLASVRSESTHSYSNNRDCNFDNAEFGVRELSATNFLETISQTNKAVIIFYYSKQCSFCNGISYTFLTIAKYFATVQELLFARVDGDLNLLPWEYTMETYPTILFIPANQVSESRVFPMDMPINLQNLIGFILANLQTSLRLEAMWTLCDKAKFNPDVMDCFLSVRLQISQTIDRTLQEWRTSHNEEKSLLSLKLQHLHDLHNLFLQYPHNVTLAENLFAKLKLIEMQPPETTI